MADDHLRRDDAAPGVIRRALPAIGWWVLAVTCAVYGTFGLVSAAIEVLRIQGFEIATRVRPAPVLFALHAALGSLPVLIGPLQLRQTIRKGRPRLHRGLGWTYAFAVGATSLVAVPLIPAFARSLDVRLAFWALVGTWSLTTAVAVLRIRQGNQRAHREWNLRSFALTCFVITFSIWVPALAGNGGPEAPRFAAAVWLSWLPNLMVAELWIRKVEGRPSALARA